ncbi:hypothetical protein, partial [Aeromonas caviae]|uniref:hypothetical protein n=1 Tax=Aeromonas caviae TaxID=648 RepID=UPI001FC8A0EE
ADLRLAVQRLISSSIVMLMSVISTHYDLSRISVGHYTTPLVEVIDRWQEAPGHPLAAALRQCVEEVCRQLGERA